MGEEEGGGEEERWKEVGEVEEEDKEEVEGGVGRR